MNFLEKQKYLQNKSFNQFVSGISAGLSSIVVVTPVEYFKILYQNKSSVKFKPL